jgi:hypothetical protein
VTPATGLQRDAVIGRSVSDEAIQGRIAALDCFASLAMTVCIVALLLNTRRLSRDQPVTLEIPYL